MPRLVGDTDRVVSFLRRATSLAKLLRVRLELPLLGPGIPPGIAQTSLAPIKPAIVGLSRASDVLRVAHALSYYRGEPSMPRNEEDKEGKTLLHELRPRINRKHRAKTTVGLHAGWDRYASDRSVSLQDTWKN